MEDMDTSEDTDPFLIEFRTWQVRYGTSCGKILNNWHKVLVINPEAGRSLSQS